jgi:hypothetical protein
MIEIPPSAWALNTSTTATTTTISTICPHKSEQGTNNEEIRIKVFRDVTLCQQVNSNWYV